MADDPLTLPEEEDAARYLSPKWERKEAGLQKEVDAGHRRRMRRLTHDREISKVRVGRWAATAASGVAAVATAVEPAMFAGLGPWAVPIAAAVTGAVQYGASYLKSSTDDDVPVEYKRYEASMAEETHGIKETLDVYTGVEQLATKVIEVGADGYQVTDAGVLVTDPELRDALVAAADGASKIRQEATDITMDERYTLIHRTVDLAAAIEGKIREVYAKDTE